MKGYKLFTLLATLGSASLAILHLRFCTSTRFGDKAALNATNRGAGYRGGPTSFESEVDTGNTSTREWAKGQSHFNSSDLWIQIFNSSIHHKKYEHRDTRFSTIAPIGSWQSKVPSFSVSGTWGSISGKCGSLSIHDIAYPFMPDKCGEWKWRAPHRFMGGS